MIVGYHICQMKMFTSHTYIVSSFSIDLKTSLRLTSRIQLKIIFKMDLSYRLKEGRMMR